MHFLTKWLLNALALLLAAYLVPGIHVEGLYVALIATLLLVAGACASTAHAIVAKQQSIEGITDIFRDRYTDNNLLALP